MNITYTQAEQKTIKKKQKKEKQIVLPIYLALVP